MLKISPKYLDQLTRPIYCFLLIFFVHIIYKLLFLDYSGFWYDETFGLYYSEQDWGLIKHTSEWDMNPPLYYYFLYIWRNLFGISEYAIRFSSVIFSSLAAGILYVLTAKNFNRLAAFIAVLLFSVSNEIYFYSHEARCYSIVLFLVLSSSYFFFELLKRPSLVSVILLGILNFLMIYTHYVTGIILALQFFIALLYFNKEIFKRINYAFLITILLIFIRFTKKTILCIISHKKDYSYTKPTWEKLTDAFYTFLNGSNLFWIFTVIILICLCNLLYSKKIKEIFTADKMKITYLILCGPGVVFLCYVASFLTPVFLLRYFLFSAPFLYVLIGFIISEVRSAAIKYIAVTLVLISSMYSISKIDFRTDKGMDYKNAMPLIKKLQTPGSVTFVETRDISALFAYYYAKTIFSDFRNLDSLLRAKNIYAVSTAEDIKFIDLKKINRLILTQSFEKVNEGDSLFQIAISKAFKSKTSTKYYSGVTISVFSK